MVVGIVVVDNVVTSFMVVDTSVVVGEPVVVDEPVVVIGHWLELVEQPYVFAPDDVIIVYVKT